MLKMSETLYEEMKKAESDYKKEPTVNNMREFVYTVMTYEKFSADTDTSNEADRLVSIIKGVEDNLRAENERLRAIAELCLKDWKGEIPPQDIEKLVKQALAESEV